MNPRLLVAAMAVLLQTSWTTSDKHIPHRIVMPDSRSRSSCLDIAKEVERFALSSGYHRLHESTGGERLALFERGDLAIQVLRRGGVCYVRVARIYTDDPMALAERQGLYSALRAHGINARLETESDYWEVVEVIDYGRQRNKPFSRVES
jgi:hypothetical protein